MKKIENQVNLKITREAANDHRELFGPVKRKEIQMELRCYITKLLEAKREPANFINYDNEKAVFLEKIEDGSYEVIGFGQVFSNVAESLQFRCNKANASGSQLHGCIHFNAGGGKGVEVYAVSEKGKEYAAKICSEIAALGYENRGSKGWKSSLCGERN